VRTFINAAGTYTALSASLMPKEVVDAITYATKHFAAITDMQDKVGARIAQLVQADGAMVTSGAAGALTVATAACIAGKNAKAIQQLPDVTGLKHEVIVQKTHRVGYDHAIRTCGARLIEVETPEELERAITPRTAMMFFYNAMNKVGKIPDEQFVALGKRHSVPTLNDAAADVPPVENLWKYTKMGFDLVAFSGGKGIRGPQSAGLLLGRKELIEAARMNTSPNGDTIARGQKVNKEEILGMLVALELFVKRDHQAEYKEWERRCKVISDAVAAIPSVTTEVWVPEIANQVPHLKIRWDADKLKLNPREAMNLLREGPPAIEANPSTNQEELVIGVWMMQPGEAEIVGKAVRGLLSKRA
jgi:D-glucosaminate-6-phosphate ammonia-lyase